MIGAVSFSPEMVVGLSSCVQSCIVRSDSAQISLTRPVRPAFEVSKQSDSLDVFALRCVESPLEEDPRAERDEPVARRDVKEPPSASLLQGSSIATFRDHATGVLVIKLVGRRNNEVLAQFPTPIQLSNYPKAPFFVAPPSSLREMA